MSFVQFPSEILIRILLYLDVPDAYALQSVNHFFHNFYRTSLQLQYELECKVAGVVDNPNCHLSIPERLQMLRKRESAWSSLTPTSTGTISVPSDTTTLYDIERTCYLLGKAPSPYGYDGPAGGVQSLSIQEPDKDTFRPIPIENLVDFCCSIDEHDLIAALTQNVYRDRCLELQLQIRLIQHSTGNDHPLAENPTITVCREEVMGVWGNIMMAMEVFGENLVLTVEVRKNLKRMYVFDWKSGKAKCEPISISNFGIIVLHRDLVIIPDNGLWSLHIYYIPPSSLGGPVKLIQILRLPPLRDPNTQIDWAQCRSAPNPTGDGLFPKHVPSSIPFLDEPETAVALFRWEFFHHGWDFLSMLVHKHSIMNTLPSPDDWPTITTPRTILWDNWGPPVTLWSELNEPGADITATTGQRHLQTSPPDNDDDSDDNGDDNESYSLVVQDFNAYNVRRAPEKRPAKETTLDMHVFREPVISQLPFIEICSEKKYAYSRQSIAADLIVGTMDTATETSLEILRFGR